MRWSPPATCCEQYMDAADQAVEKALKAQERPQPQTWVFNSNFRQQPELDYAHSAVFQQKFMALYSTSKTVNEEGAYGPLHAFSQGVPVDGILSKDRPCPQAESRREPRRSFPYDPATYCSTWIRTRRSGWASFRAMRKSARCIMRSPSSPSWAR